MAHYYESIAVRGTNVVRIGSLRKYTTGRAGTVIDFNIKTGRIRVHWMYDRYGVPLDKGIRTWVHERFLTKLILKGGKEI